MNGEWSQIAANGVIYQAQMAFSEFAYAGSEACRPSVLFRPTLSADGNMWCALLGNNLQEGVAGFGETPEAAMRAFDEAFASKRTPPANQIVRTRGNEPKTLLRKLLTLWSWWKAKCPECERLGVECDRCCDGRQI